MGGASKPDLASELAATRAENARLREQIAEQADTRYRLLTDNLPGLFSVVRPDHTYGYVNTAYARQFGRPREEILGRHMKEIVGPTLYAQVSPAIDDVLGGATRDIEAEVAREGQVRHLRGHLVPEMGADGAVLAVIALITDITSLRRVQAELKASEERFRKIFDTGPECVKILDKAGRLRAMNAAGLQMIEAESFDEVRGAEVSMLVHEASRSAFEKLTRDVCATQGSGTLEFQLTGQKGTVRWLETHAVPIEGEEGEAQLLAVTRDITARKRAEEERAKLEAQLRHAQKMEAIGLLAGGIAHDFNNALSVISCNVEIAQDPSVYPALMEELLEDIRSATNHAAHLTRQLVSFSRKQIAKPQTVDLNELVRLLRPMLSRVLGDDVIVEVALSSDLGAVEMDPIQLEQIVLNLVINARDAMPDGGTLRIETRNVNVEEDRLGGVTGPHVELSVHDEGCGISEEDQERIFEPFFTTKVPGRGTGLGLSTVFGIVKQNSGRIDVESAVGRGTTFALRFPRSTKSQSTTDEQRTSQRRGGQETILLVEDDNMVLQSTLRLLQRLGYRVLPAQSGEEALGRASEHDGRIDLLFTDVVMPHMDGHELVKHLAKSHPSLQVLFTSGHVRNMKAHEDALARGAHFIAKPYSMDAIAKSLRTALDD